MAADIVGLDLLVQQHMTHNGTEYRLFLDAGYPVGKFRSEHTQSRACLFVYIYVAEYWVPMFKDFRKFLSCRQIYYHTI